MKAGGPRRGWPSFPTRMTTVASAIVLGRKFEQPCSTSSNLARIGVFRIYRLENIMVHNHHLTLTLLWDDVYQKKYLLMPFFVTRKHKPKTQSPLRLIHFPMTNVWGVNYRHEVHAQSGSIWTTVTKIKQKGTCTSVSESGVWCVLHKFTNTKKIWTKHPLTT